VTDTNDLPRVEAIGGEPRLSYVRPHTWTVYQDGEQRLLINSQDVTDLMHSILCGSESSESGATR